MIIVSTYLCIVICIKSSLAQHWWNWEDLLRPHITPYFTPIPNSRFTHEPERSPHPPTVQDVIVSVPKAGLGTYVGKSQWVDYDYTWTRWPAPKGRQVNLFLGIPYAAPPVNDERFRIPRPSFLDVRYLWYAKNYKPACMQDSSYLNERIPGFNDFREDCLYLNLFYPNNTYEPPTTRYPVIVYIHGGDFVYGSAHLYPGHALASLGTMVVTFNYRLGVFGFMSTGDFASIGNYGLWDQIEALKWVRDNIFWFRGDPGLVTVMGEGAGAASVGLHLVSPESRSLGLFHKVIMMSGSDLGPWSVSNPLTTRTMDFSKDFADKLGCSTRDNYYMMYCVRYYQDSEKMLAISTNISGNSPATDYAWGPVVDGQMGFLPRMPLVERMQNRYSAPPILIGFSHDELSRLADKHLKKWGLQGITDPVFDEDSFTNGIKNFLKYLKVRYTKDMYDELYFRYNWWSQPTNESARREQFVAMYSDWGVRAGVDHVTKFQAEKQPVVYAFEFASRGRNDTTNKYLGIYQDTIGQFVFGLPFMNTSWWRDLLSPQPPAAIGAWAWDKIWDTNMSEFMMQMWVNFIRYDNPTPFEIRNFTWLPYTNTEQNYAHLFINASNRQRYRQNHMSFWRERYEIVAEPEEPVPTQFPYELYKVQIATYVLGVVIFFCLIGLVIIVVLIIKKPMYDPDTYVPPEDEFAAAFRESFISGKTTESRI